MWKSALHSTSKSSICNYFVNGHCAHVEVHRVNLAMEPKLASHIFQTAGQSVIRCRFREFRSY